MAQIQSAQYQLLNPCRWRMEIVFDTGNGRMPSNRYTYQAE
jgi:hypothetical protein